MLLRQLLLMHSHWLYLSNDKRSELKQFCFRKHSELCGISNLVAWQHNWEPNIMEQTTSNRAVGDGGRLVKTDREREREREQLTLPCFFSLSKGRTARTKISVISGTFRIMLVAHNAAWNKNTELNTRWKRSWIGLKQ